MDTSDIRKNVKMMLDGAPYTVVDFQFVKPGKGQAFTRVKIRNLISGAVLERTFKSGEKLKPADVEDRQLQYIYSEADAYVFMDPQSGDQLYVNHDKIGEEEAFLHRGLNLDVTLWNGQPVAVSLPAHVILDHPQRARREGRHRQQRHQARHPLHRRRRPGPPLTAI